MPLTDLESLPLYPFSLLLFDKLKEQPIMAGLNYFLTHGARGGEGNKLLGEKRDVKAWLGWLELRVHGDVVAIETPIGCIPKYEDLKSLFQQVFSRDYTRELYEKQFSIRIQKFLEKIERMEKIYGEEEDIPQAFTNIMKDQKERLLSFMKKHGKDVVSPFEL